MTDFLNNQSITDVDESTEAVTTPVGWAPVRDIPPIFANAVAKAEAATIKWHNQQNLISLDERVINWESIYKHDHFPISCLTFRLDALNRCGIAYMDRGERFQQEKDFEKSEKCFREALKLAPDIWPDSAKYLHNLGLLKLNYYQTYNLTVTELNETIDYIQQAIEKAAPEDQNLSLYRYTLSIALGYRYERLGALADLERAILHGEKALDLSLSDKKRRGMYLNNLGILFRKRFKRKKLLNDIEQAISLHQAAIQESDSDVQLPYRHTNLGNDLLARYDLTGDVEDLEHALDNHQKAVDMTQEGDPSLVIRLNNLGNSLRGKYVHSRAVSDLNRAITIYQRVVELTSSTDPLLPSRLYNLGNILYLRYERTRNSTDVEQGVQSYRNACITGLEYSLEWVLGAAKAWGGWAYERQAWQEAKEAYNYALKAIDQLYRTQLLSESKATWLKDARDLACNAAYVLARLDELQEAVLTLERSRTRALSEALTYQDASVKAASDKDQQALIQVTQRIRELESEARAIGQAGIRDFLAISTDLQSAREELSSIVNRIRSYLPDFIPEGLDFSAITFLVDALNQPLVYLLTTLNGSLALIVTPVKITAPDASVIHSVWLDEFSLNTLNDILYDQDSLPRYLHGIAVGENEILQKVMDEIWSILDRQLMQPIVFQLRQLGHQRAVLIPAGTLALLPIHAVALDKITFTFVPSARALWSVYHDKDHVNLLPSLLGIGNPFSYQQHSLGFARFEVENIAELFTAGNRKVKTLFERAATQSNVIAAIPTRTHLHFACHGSFNVSSPMESALFLAGDDTLTLRDLLDGDLDVSAVRLVVLSACQTGIIDFRNVPDETVGFPAGFIQASVPGIVSTLWPVDDASTAIMLSKFYQYHLKDSLEPGIALHKAQLWLRDSTASEMNLPELYERLYNASKRRAPQAFHAMRYYKANPDVKPFSHPYYWAAFTFTGV